MNSPSDELTAIRQELEQLRQDFAASRKELQHQIALGVVRGFVGILLVGFTLQLILALVVGSG